MYNASEFIKGVYELGHMHGMRDMHRKREHVEERKTYEETIQDLVNRLKEAEARALSVQPAPPQAWGRTDPHLGVVTERLPRDPQPWSSPAPNVGTVDTSDAHIVVTRQEYDEVRKQRDALADELERMKRANYEINEGRNKAVLQINELQDKNYKLQKEIEDKDQAIKRLLSEGNALRAEARSNARKLRRAGVTQKHNAKGDK